MYKNLIYIILVDYANERAERAYVLFIGGESDYQTVLITPACFLKESAELRNPEESSRNASQLARDSMEFLRNAKGFLKD